MVIPALSTIESLVRSVRNQAERDVYQAISNTVPDKQKQQLDGLWQITPQSGSMLGWLRRSPRSCTPAGICDLLERLGWIRGIGLPAKALGSISPHRIRQLAAREDGIVASIFGASPTISVTRSWLVSFFAPLRN